MKKTTLLPLVLAMSLALAGSGLSQDKDPAADQEAAKPKPEAKAPPKSAEARPKPPTDKPRPEPSKGPERKEAGPHHPDVAKFREQMQARMREVQELRQAGKHEEAEKKMAEGKRQMEALRSRFQHEGGPRGPHGPGGPPPMAHEGPKRPPMDAARPPAPKPEAPKVAEKPSPRPEPEAKPEHRGGPGPHVPEKFAEMRERMQARMQEVRELHQQGKPEEAAAKIAEIRKHVESMRGQHGKGPGGPSWAHRGPHKPGEKAKAKADRPGKGKRHRQAGKQARKRMAAPFRQAWARRAMMARMQQGPQFRGFAGPRPPFRGAPFAGPHMGGGPRPPMMGRGFGPRPDFRHRGPGFQAKGPRDHQGFHGPRRDGRPSGKPGDHHRLHGEKAQEKKGASCKNCEADAKAEKKKEE